MGRQFSYYCSPEDLAEIEAKVFAPAGGKLLMTEKRDQRHYIVPVAHFPLARELMGTQSLSLLLAPPDPLGSVVFEGPWLQTARSHLIEVDRCYIKDGSIRTGRFWYEPRAFVNGEFHEKPKEFVVWAQAIFRRTKQLLSRQSFSQADHSFMEWFGPQAWREVREGTLHARLN